MRFTKTDDPIKGIGFVATCFSGLEDEVDELLKQSGQLFSLPDTIDRWKFGNRVEWLQKQFRQAFAAYPYPSSDQEGKRVEFILAACREVALKRNELRNL